MNKTLKEFTFLQKDIGLRKAIYYMYYKVRLKIYYTKIFDRQRENKNALLKKIGSSLFVHHNKEVVKGKRKYVLMQYQKYGIESILLRPHTSDRDVFFQVFVNEDYKNVVNIYQQIFGKTANVIFDCGSNIGLTSLYFSRFFPKAKYVAIEPFEDNIKMVKLNFVANNLHNYQIVEGGVWNKVCKLNFNTDFRDGREWGINLTEARTNELGNIQAFSILELINTQNQLIDILKIDIEGSEKVIFDDKEYAAAFLKKVKCIGIEIHDEFNCRERIYEILSDNNFFYYNVADMTIALNRSHMISLKV